MVKNYGYIGLDNFETATQEAKKEFSKIFKDTDFLQGGSPYYVHIVDLLKPIKEKKLIDLGYGRGFFLKIIEDSKLELYGLDFCEEAKNTTSKIVKNAKLLVGDMHSLPFKDNTFDYITCLGVIEHLVNPKDGIKEIARILKPEGIALFTIPNSIYTNINMKKQIIFYNLAKTMNQLKLRKKKAIHIRQPIDRFYTPKESKDLLEKNGLKVYYAELLKSKRNNFKILKKFENGNITTTPAFLKANFTLLMCKKNLQE